MKAKILLPLYDFKHNLKSSIVIFLVITLSVILCVATLISIKSFINYRESLNEINDSYDLVFLDIKYDDYLELLKYNDTNINDLFFAHNIGYAKLNQNLLNNKNYMLIEEMTPDGLTNEGFNLIGGTLPTSDTELLISSEYSSIHNIKIGDSITYNIGNIISEEENEYYRLKSYDESFESFEFNPILNKEYIVVGIYDKSNSIYINNTDLSHYYAYTYMDERILDSEELIDVLMSLHDKTRLSKDLENYKLLLKPAENNLVVLQKDSVNYDAKYKNHTYFIAVILLLIIVTLSIKSSFNYGSKKRKEFYSEEMCLGATNKDIKQSWYYLTYALAILGIISGIYFSNLLLHYFIKVLVNKEKIDILLTEMLSKGIMLYAALIILIAITIAYVLSEKKILYVTALDYLKNKYEPIDPKYVHYDEYTELKGEISKYIKSNFVLNHINDNKLMFSLPFLIAFLMLSLSFIFILTKPIVDYIDRKDIDLTININDLESHIESLNNISKIDGVKDYLISGYAKEALYLKKEYVKNESYSFLKIEDEYVNYPVNIIVVDDSKYDYLVKKDNDIVLIPTFNILKNNEIMRTRLFESEELEEIEIFSEDNSYLLNNILITDIDSSILKTKNGCINLLVKKSKFATLFEDLTILYNSIDLIINDHIFIDRLNDYATQNKIDIDIIYNVESLIYNPNSNYIVLAYNFGILVSSISMLLFCLIIYTSLNTYVTDREREIALLRTIGISSKNINQIINGEFGDAYFIAALVGIIIGAFLTNKLCDIYVINELKSVGTSMNLLLFYIILFMVMISVFFISLLRSTRKLRRKSPIEFLKVNFREY